MHLCNSSVTFTFHLHVAFLYIGGSAGSKTSLYDNFNIYLYLSS
jgi:hypothetical protein